MRIEFETRLAYALVACVMALLLALSLRYAHRLDWLHPGPDARYRPDDVSASAEFEDWRYRERQRRAMLERVRAHREKPIHGRLA
jgi:hypothetical protein